MTSYSRLNPSPMFKELTLQYQLMHSDGVQGEKDARNTFPGKSLLEHVPLIKEMVKKSGSHTLIDYGCGKAALYYSKDFNLNNGEIVDSIKSYWGVSEVKLYDPGVEEFSSFPNKKYDGLISTDVLEHIPEDDIDWILNECFSLAEKFIYMNIASYPALKKLPNGWNAHVTIKSPEWWRDKIEKASKDWAGLTYVFEVAEKRSGFMGRFIKALGGGRYKVTRISMGFTS